MSMANDQDSPTRPDPMGLYETGDDAVHTAFRGQIIYCEKNAAPVTARVVAALLALLDDPELAARPLIGAVRRWPGPPVADALALRVAGALHTRFLSGDAPELTELYEGHDARPADDAAAVRAVILREEARMLPWLDGPPQTNEAGRSWAFIAAMLWVADQGLPATFALSEIGSSAGINLMLDRYGYDLGGVTVGPEQPVMAFAPEWRRPPPPSHPIRIASVQGSDIAPVDLTDPDQALRLKGYIWPEHRVRFDRMDAAIAAATQRPPQLVRAPAADGVRAMLNTPPVAGQTRVLMHSIMWQYLDRSEQDAITAMMEAAGADATADAPLAWIALEANRTVHYHELRVRYWPGRPEEQILATGHAHGAWVDWKG